MFYGFGETVFKNGLIHRGQYKSGITEGKGEIKFLDEIKFNGDFKNNNIEGKGKMNLKMEIFIMVTTLTMIFKEKEY